MSALANVTYYLEKTEKQLQAIHEALDTIHIDRHLGLMELTAPQRVRLLVSFIERMGLTWEDIDGE